MRRTNRAGNFLITFIFNLLLNSEWVIAIIIASIMHYKFDFSKWWLIGAWCCWLVPVLISTILLKVLSRASSGLQEVEQENKNPYSAKNREGK